MHCCYPQWPHNGVVCCCMQRMAYSARIALYHALSMGMTQYFFVFCPRWPWPLTLTFELWRDFCTVHLTIKFHRPTFNCLEVIVRTNKQMPLKTFTSLCSAGCRWVTNVHWVKSNMPSALSSQYKTAHYEGKQMLMNLIRASVTVVVLFGCTAQFDWNLISHISTITPSLMLSVSRVLDAIPKIFREHQVTV